MHTVMPYLFINVRECASRFVDIVILQSLYIYIYIYIVVKNCSYTVLYLLQACWKHYWLTSYIFMCAWYAQRKIWYISGVNYTYIYIYTPYIYTYIYMYICIYIYIYIYIPYTYRMYIYIYIYRIYIYIYIQFSYTDVLIGCFVPSETLLCHWVYIEWTGLT